MQYWALSNSAKEEIAEIVIELRNAWMSLREISKQIEWEYWISIWKSTVWDIVAKHAIDEIEDDIEDSDIEYDEQNLYVYTTKITQYWDKLKVRHIVPFTIVNKLQRAYSSKWLDWTQQKILDHNWWNEDNPIYIKEKVWNAIKSAIWLNKLSWITNEIYLKILYDKFGKSAVEWYVEEAAHDTTRERFREIEKNSMDRALTKQYEKVVRTWLRLEEYCDRIIDSLWLNDEQVMFPPKSVPNQWETLYVVFWDMHVGRTSRALRENVTRMISYLEFTWYENFELINIWDNLESPLLQWMHTSQIAEMDYRWFDQITVAADTLKFIIESIQRFWECQMYWLVWNHWRGSVSSEDDPERLPELAMYAIADAYTGRIKYNKKPVRAFETVDFNFIASHWDYWFAWKNPDQIMSMVISNDDINHSKHTLIVNWHYHNPQINQWPNYTKIQVPSLNETDSYSRDIVIKKCFPWFVTIESIEGRPKISFIPC